jgi:hypothetical protein
VQPGDFVGVYSGENESDRSARIDIETSRWRERIIVAKACGHGVNDSAFLELWENPEISEYIISAAIELEKDRLNSENINKEFMFWIAQEIGLLHAKYHNSLAEKSNMLTQNPAFDNMPERIRKLFGFSPKVEKVEMNDEQMFLLTATRSQKEAYFLQKNKV